MLYDDFCHVVVVQQKSVATQSILYHFSVLMLAIVALHKIERICIHIRYLALVGFVANAYIVAAYPVISVAPSSLRISSCLRHHSSSLILNELKRDGAAKLNAPGLGFQILCREKERVKSFTGAG